jgi:uncharacterized damage-inducible protein DinB
MRIPDVTAMLARTPETLTTLLVGLPEEWLHRNDGPQTWSAYDIAGHLLLADTTNWLPRIRTVLEYGTDRQFAPFDRQAMLGWQREPVAALLQRFRTTRSASLTQLDELGLADDDLRRRGAHPEFGVVSLEQVVAAWVAHDLTHVAQISEVLARRYRETVGPYRKYLPALDRVAEAE